MSRENDSFKSKIGVILAIIGSAVGFGNFWRFPYLVGENGGAAFLFIYILIGLVIGIPLIISEYIIGKSTHKDFIGAFKDLRPGSKWFLIGYLTLLTVILITGFYSVVGGWTVFSLLNTIFHGTTFTDTEIIKDSFYGFINTGYKPIILSILFIGICVLIVIRGIQKGSEKFNKILIPVFALVILVMCINAITLPGFSKSMTFLFHADFSKLNFNTVIDAFGQVFFSLSVGMGIYATYASYVTKEENVLSGQSVIALSDTFVSILAGIIIFSAAFTYGINPSEGPTLVFIALPSIFAQMPMGILFGILFYIVLGIAAITSAISLIEVVATCLIDQFNITRKKACIIIFILESAIASLCCLSQVDGIELKILGMNIFEFLDTITANWMLTFACFITSLFIGWVMNQSTIDGVITGNGKHSKWFIKPYIIVIRYIAPLAMFILIINKTGIVS